MDATDHPHRRGVEVGAFASPLVKESVNGVLAHVLTIPSLETILSSVETIYLRAALVAAVAPAAWGSTYIVTESLLPPDRPLFAALLRALPVGLVLLGLRRELPRGSWWWKAAVLGMLNIGVFFPLIFVSAYHLPGGLAATLQATSPLAVMAVAWPLIGERPVPVRVAAGLVGILGVVLLVLRTPGEVSATGLAAAAGSVLVSAVGFVLVKRWPTPVPMLTLVSWQLVVGGLVLLPVALVVEGAPPAIDMPAALGYAWIGIVGTGIAYWCWFTGLTRMPAGATALVGLVNPVVGTVLGIVIAGEVFGWPQALGMALVLGGVVAGQRGRRGAAPGPRGSGHPGAVAREQLVDQRIGAS